MGGQGFQPWAELGQKPQKSIFCGAILDPLAKLGVECFGGYIVLHLLNYLLELSPFLVLHRRCRSPLQIKQSEQGQ